MKTHEADSPLGGMSTMLWLKIAFLLSPLLPPPHFLFDSKGKCLYINLISKRKAIVLIMQSRWCVDR